MSHDDPRPQQTLAAPEIPQPRQEPSVLPTGTPPRAVVEFGVIHDAMRVAVQALADAAAGTRLGDAPRINTLVRACTVAVGFVRHHHRGEDEHWWPAFRAQAAAAGDQLAPLTADHHELEPILEDIEAQSAFLRRDPTDAEALRGLTDSTAALRDHILEHLAVEEPVLFPLLAALPTETADQLSELSARTAPKKGLPYFFGFLAAGAPDRQQLILDQMPKPVVLLRPLALRRYRRAMARLGATG